MQLQERTTYEVKSHLKIARVRFVIAEHADPTKRKEWNGGPKSQLRYPLSGTAYAYGQKS